MGGQGVDDFPALFFGGRDEGADGREVGRAFERAEAAGDFLAQFHHAAVAFSLIVGEGNGRIVQETQRVLPARREPRQQVMSSATRRAPATFAAAFYRQRRLGFVEGQPLCDDGVITAVSYTHLRAHETDSY